MIENARVIESTKSGFIEIFATIKHDQGIAIKKIDHKNNSIIVKKLSI